MPDKYIIEMFCDRVAASKIYQKDKYTDASAYEYFEMGRKRRLPIIHESTSNKLEKLLLMLKNEGEKKTFAYLRKCKGNLELL